MDKIDRQLIELTQSGLPLTAEPYQTIAEQMGLTAKDVKTRLIKMQNKGVIRRIAAVPNHYRLGYCCNGMTVWDIDDLKINVMGNTIGQLDFVSHCYHRPRHLPIWPYNLFAMVHGKTQQEVELKIQRIAEIVVADCRTHDVLYSTEILKKTGFRVSKVTCKK